MSGTECETCGEPVAEGDDQWGCLDCGDTDGDGPNCPTCGRFRHKCAAEGVEA